MNFYVLRPINEELFYVRHINVALFLCLCIVASLWMKHGLNGMDNGTEKHVEKR